MDRTQVEKEAGRGSLVKNFLLLRLKIIKLLMKGARPLLGNGINK